MKERQCFEGDPVSGSDAIFAARAEAGLSNAPAVEHVRSGSDEYFQIDRPGIGTAKVDVFLDRDPHAYLQDLVVYADARSKGHSYELVKAAAAYAKELGAQRPEARLEVEQSLRTFLTVFGTEAVALSDIYPDSAGELRDSIARGAKAEYADFFEIGPGVYATVDLRAIDTSGWDHPPVVMVNIKP